MDNKLQDITQLADVFAYKEVGETVNVHVVRYEPEPKPDYDAMKRTLEG